MNSSSPPQSRPVSPVYFGPYDVTSQVFLTTRHSFALVNLKPLLPGHVLVCSRKIHRRLTDLSPPELTDLFEAVQRVQRMLARHYFAPFSPSSSSTDIDTDTPGPRPRKPVVSTTEAIVKGPRDLSPPPPHPPSSSGVEEGTIGAEPERGSFNIAIQDGLEAGQTVPHLHVHVIPRIRGENGKDNIPGPGDAVYEQMAAEAGNVGGALWDRLQGEGDNGKRRPAPGGGFPRIEDQDRLARSMVEMEAEAGTFRRVLREMEEDEKEGVCLVDHGR